MSFDEGGWGIGRAFIRRWWWCGAKGCGDGVGRCGNPSGSRPNFFGRQHLTFDKGGKFSARRGIVRFWKVNATSQIIHRRKIISDFIIIAHLGKVNGSYRIVTISLALSNRFSGRRTLPGSNGTFNVIFRFSLLTNCVVMDYNYVRSV